MSKLMWSMYTAICAFGLLLAMVPGTVQAANVEWDGHGTNDGYCQSTSYDPTITGQLWQFNLTKPADDGWVLSATFNPNNDVKIGDGEKKSDQGVSVVHFIVETSIGARLVSASATGGTVGPGQSGSILTVSHCVIGIQPLVITKDVETSFDRTWEWDLEKFVYDEEEENWFSSLSLGSIPLGENETVKYLLRLVAEKMDWNHKITGNIGISNPNSTLPAYITGVEDVLKDEGEDLQAADSIVCSDSKGEISFTPYYVLDGGEEIICEYTIDVTGRVGTDNWARVSTVVDSEVPGAQTEVPVVWDDEPSKTIDRCVSLTDDKVNLETPHSFGEYCADEDLSDLSEDENEVLGVEEEYELIVGTGVIKDIELECGENTLTNTARFVSTDDEEVFGIASAIVTAELECITGCTLTQGYWKTHSKYGPAPMDERWEEIGEDTLFFSSGKSYYEVLWTAPAGNVYYVLAHQYIAAELNEVAGADFPDDVQDAFNKATELLKDQDPDLLVKLKGKAGNETRAKWTQLAGILDEFNNGLLGVPHCDAQPESGEMTILSEAELTSTVTETEPSQQPEPAPAPQYEPVIAAPAVILESFQKSLVPGKAKR